MKQMIRYSKIIFTSALVSMGLVQSNAAERPFCSDPMRRGELCYNMRYLKSQVLALGAQRELMQVNYPYLQIIGLEIDSIAQNLRDNKLINAEHESGILAVQEKAKQLATEAQASDYLALATANVIQKRCVACHSATAPISGIEWDQIFKNDWENIVKNCSREGRTPYLCKSMNGMLSSYSGILASSQLGRKSFPALKQSALEIARIASDLQNKKIYHQTEPLSGVQAKAEEVAKLAEQENPEAFEKGLMITQSCMQCHATLNVSSGINQRLFISSL